MRKEVVIMKKQYITPQISDFRIAASDILTVSVSDCGQGDIVNWKDGLKIQE